MKTQITKQAILFALILVTSFSFGQRKKTSIPSKKGKTAQMIINDAINSNKVIKNNFFEAWPAKVRAAYILNVADYTCAYHNDKKKTLNIMIKSMISNKLISKSEGTIISSWIAIESVKKSKLQSAIKRKYSTKFAQNIIVTLAKNRLKGFEKNKPNDDIPATAQGLGRNIGTIVGAVGGFFAAGGASAGAGAAAGGILGATVGGALGDAIETLVTGDGCIGQRGRTPPF